MAVGEALQFAQICDNRNPTTILDPAQRWHTPCKVENPTISQSCRQDSTSTAPPSSNSVDVYPTLEWWDSSSTAATDGGCYNQLLHYDDDYFKANLTDDKFLSENVNIACNSSVGLQQQQQQQQQVRSKLRSDARANVDPRDSSDKSHRVPSGVKNFDSLHKSIDTFLVAERQSSPKCNSVTVGDLAPSESKNSTRYISFTDGEFIFGPYDPRSEEFQRFNLWDGDFPKRRNCCCHHRPCKQRSPSGTASDGSSSASTASTLCHYCQQRSSATSSETLKEAENETPQSPRHQEANQVENYDDTPKIVPAGNELPQRPTSISYGRWVRFENGNIAPSPPEPQSPSGHHRSGTPRVPTPYPSPTDDHEDEDRDHHQDIFDQFAAAIEHQPQSKPDLVENVPLIDAVLDDLLTFSKTLVLRHSPTSCAEDFPLATVREEAKIVEINDDNLINLLADDDDNSETKVVGETQSRHSVLGGANAALGMKSLPSKHDDMEDDARTKRKENSGNESFREEKCALNTDEGRQQLESSSQHCPVDDSKDVIDNYLSTRRNQEDIFANVAIFSWNPLDVFHQHGLFMIDPRFALADLRTTTPDVGNATYGQDDSYNEGATNPVNDSRRRNGAHLNSPKRESASNARHSPSVAEAAPEVQIVDDDTGRRTKAGIGITGITDGADPSSADVKSFATQLAALGDTSIGTDGDDGCLLESHKIPNDRTSPMAMDHFYDSAHVEYPVRADLCTIIQECHQSPRESDYDNDPTKNATTTSASVSGGSLQRPQSLGRDETEGTRNDVVSFRVRALTDYHLVWVLV